MHSCEAGDRPLHCQSWRCWPRQVFVFLGRLSWHLCHCWGCVLTSVGAICGQGSAAPFALSIPYFLLLAGVLFFVAVLYYQPLPLQAFLHDVFFMTLAAKWRFSLRPASPCSTQGSALARRCVVLSNPSTSAQVVPGYPRLGTTTLFFLPARLSAQPQK